MRPSPHLLFFTFKSETLAPELQVTMVPCLHLWFLHPKLRLYDLKYKSLLFPHLTHVFCIQNSDFSPRVASHYGSQPSSVVLCTHNSGIITRINSLYWSQTSPVILCMQKAVISIRITSLHRPRLHLSFCACKTT